MELDADDKLATQFYDKLDEFNFSIVSFSYMYLCSNYLLSLASGVNSPQLI
jgi:hypothetical protein